MTLHIVALAVFPLLFALGAAVLPLRAAAALSAWWRARRERQQLARLGEQGLLVVTGTLRVEGPLEQVGGRALGCMQTWSSGRRFWFKRASFLEREQAKKLTVVAGDQRYELSGPVHVLAGSRTEFAGVRAATLPRGFVVRSSLYDGDEVTVAGSPAAAVEGVDYRGSGAGVIAPSSDGGAVFACAHRSQSTVVPAKALGRHFSVLLVAVLGCLPLIGFARDSSSTECAEACKSFGLCTIESNLVRLGWGKALERLRRGDHVDCSASSDDMCRASEHCKESGQCSEHAGSCVARTPEDCRDARSCVEFGQCSPAEGFCRALTAEDCRYTSGCDRYGSCFPWEGYCKEVSTESCRAQPACARYGRCGVLGGSCAATAPEHCSTMDDCLEHGRCSPVAGECKAASDTDCQSSRRCREHGQCSLVDGACVAKLDSDCRASARCAKASECRAEGGECVADAPSCRESAACATWGACVGDSYCEAGSKADCAKAEVCKGKAGCKPIAGICATSCRETDVCRSMGWCTLTDKGECVAKSEADCAASESCRVLGKCSLGESGCVLRSTADCEKTQGCRAVGTCTLVDGLCAAAASQCAATPGCKIFGRCSRSSDSLDCEVTSADDCKQSEACEKRGWCTPTRAPFSPYLQCGPAPR